MTASITRRVYEGWALSPVVLRLRRTDVVGVVPRMTPSITRRVDVGWAILPVALVGIKTGKIAHPTTRLHGLTVEADVNSAQVQPQQVPIMHVRHECDCTNREKHPADFRQP